MKTALEDISRGNFKGALKRIEAKELELNSRNSLKLVISCCAVCNKNECKTLVEDISSLLRVCAANIEELDESLLKNYLQSIFHIMKYLVEKVRQVFVFVELLLNYVLCRIFCQY